MINKDKAKDLVNQWLRQHSVSNIGNILYAGEPITIILSGIKAYRISIIEKSSRGDNKIRPVLDVFLNMETGEFVNEPATEWLEKYLV